MRTSKRTIRIGSAIGTGVVVLILFVVFVLAVAWFRTPKEEVQSEFFDSIADVLTPDPISQAVINGIDIHSKEAFLRWVNTGELLGDAERGIKDEKYYLDMKLVLPEIDREVHYYQVWLVRKLPYDYFSIGEMVTNEDGEFVLEWEAPDDEDYFDYTKMVITVNQYEGSSDPGDHLVEGEFGGDDQ